MKRGVKISPAVMDMDEQIRAERERKMRSSQDRQILEMEMRQVEPPAINIIQCGG